MIEGTCVAITPISVSGLPGASTGTAAAAARGRIISAVTAFLQNTGNRDLTLSICTGAHVDIGGVMTPERAVEKTGPAPAPISISGLPGSSTPTDAAVARGRISSALADYMRKTGNRDLKLSICTGAHVDSGTRTACDEDIENRVRKFKVVTPPGSSEIVLPDKTVAAIEAALDIINYSLEDWGFREETLRLNLHGPPGTGKTTAGRKLVKEELGGKVIEATYGDIEHMGLAEGPKNLKAAFIAANRANAPLFLNDAGGLFRHRNPRPQQAAEGAGNDLCEEMLNCLDTYRVIVIATTNFVDSWDRALFRRFRHVEFELPGAEMRERIWKACLPSAMPRAKDLDTGELSSLSVGFAGREIENAARAAARLARKSGEIPAARHFRAGIDLIRGAAHRRCSLDPRSENQYSLRI
jgi:hypothetical protein